MKLLLHAFVSTLALGAFAPDLHAQWTVVPLGPGEVLGVNGSQQVGETGGRAALWYGSSASLVDLGAGSARATDGTSQVGVVGGRAAIWTGSPGSYVDLHPEGYALSAASDVDGNVQCGTAAHSLSLYACVWNGTANSISFLTAPVSTNQVAALGVHASEVVGYFRNPFGGANHACLWTSGTPSSLHPAGASASEALDVHAGAQVGSATFAGAPHAALWTGSAGSFVDLQPVGATSSVARGVRGNVQVGEVTVGGLRRASLWNGTSASHVDLHAFLPSGVSDSYATGVWTDDNGVVYVSANGFGAGAFLLIDATNAVTTFCRGDGTGTACPCGNDAPSGSDTGCLNSLGIGGKLVASGTASFSNDQLVLQGSQMPGTSSALYFQGTMQQSGGAGAAFGDGLRCAAGSVIRLGTKTNSAGSSSYPAVGDVAIGVKGEIAAPGVTRTYQVWYRNTASFCTPSGFNLTNGVAVSWTP